MYSGEYPSFHLKYLFCRQICLPYNIAPRGDRTTHPPPATSLLTYLIYVIKLSLCRPTIFFYGGASEENHKNISENIT
jgi:hypothetical protein